MTEDHLDACFAQENLDALFPPERADQFFEALLGDAQEGAYDIRLTYQGRHSNQLRFFLELRRRPGKCLVCNLTYGLPNVFTRHPVINIDELVSQLGQLMGNNGSCRQWQLKATEEISRELHVVPLIIELA